MSIMHFSHFSNLRGPLAKLKHGVTVAWYVSHTWKICIWQIMAIVKRDTTEHERDLAIEEANYTSTHSMGTRSTDSPNGSLREVASSATQLLLLGSLSHIVISLSHAATYIGLWFQVVKYEKKIAFYNHGSTKCVLEGLQEGKANTLYTQNMCVFICLSVLVKMNHWHFGVEEIQLSQPVIKWLLISSGNGAIWGQIVGLHCFGSSQIYFG